MLTGSEGRQGWGFSRPLVTRCAAAPWVPRYVSCPARLGARLLSPNGTARPRWRSNARQICPITDCRNPREPTTSALAWCFRGGEVLVPPVAAGSTTAARPHSTASAYSSTYRRERPGNCGNGHSRAEAGRQRHALASCSSRPVAVIVCPLARTDDHAEAALTHRDTPTDWQKPLIRNLRG